MSGEADQAPCPRGSVAPVVRSPPAPRGQLGAGRVPQAGVMRFVTQLRFSAAHALYFSEPLSESSVKVGDPRKVTRVPVGGV